MKKLVIAEPAARDLEEIVDYIALDNPVAAEGVYRGIVAVASKLPQFPALGRPGRHPDTRELSVSGLPYLIVYEVSAEMVTIVAVFHTARDLVRALRERMQGDQAATHG
ncbi:MAG: type II toxin-antitoxin system RelE/ParE family toxin [Paracoccus sp. (in: a-proteobacteria)]|uniref:type II toxin-antitoxin system RelE/ParE family toxin n=1 Tax=Paracoccus sp. TaxID=267 RepID=UPI0026E0BEDE|nr:type II toxin-antitoxin system RelE/ParE family toxin [Paracoccus sp. (in: a-proteobacteria)]MDO5631626.1 type II toxin-antitoxin system RelE/ParE family toxin [Paracoccus sp. (in: a-proteobacteria)]